MVTDRNTRSPEAKSWTDLFTGIIKIINNKDRIKNLLLNSTSPIYTLSNVENKYEGTFGLVLAEGTMRLATNNGKLLCIEYLSHPIDPSCTEC